MADSYPEFAAQVGLEGIATLSCAVETTGALADCTVLVEQPLDIGFGKAALDLSKMFKMRPMALDGQPIAGGTVRIPIRFSLPRERSTPVPQFPKVKGDAEALALARRIVATQAAADAYYRIPRLKRDSATQLQLSQPLPGTGQPIDLALDAFVSSMAADLTEIQARVLAGKLPVAALTEDLNYYDGPAYKAWVAARAANAKMETAWEAAAIVRAVRPARDLLCVKTNCPTEPAPAPLEPPDVDLERLTLARALILRGSNGFSVAQVLTRLYGSLDPSLVTASGQEAKQAVGEALNLAAAEVRAEMMEMSARGYARQMSIEELRAVERHDDVLRARPATPSDEKADDQLQGLLWIALNRASRAAHDAFCNATACVNNSPPSKR